MAKRGPVLEFRNFFARGHGEVERTSFFPHPADFQENPKGPAPGSGRHRCAMRISKAAKLCRRPGGFASSPLS